ncbi:hypothetical protein D910_04261 [Dendroctonus ponderosae]|nr:hypothetical protein D910_04261 [Dendroctonus ponderosae]
MDRTLLDGRQYGDDNIVYIITRITLHLAYYKVSTSSHYDDSFSWHDAFIDVLGQPE